MNYSQETQDLMDRMCRNVEREDFILNKKKAEECLLKTYDLFGLARPKKTVWLNDIFNEKWTEVAGPAGAAWSVGSAASAASAWSTGSALAAWPTGSARAAWSTWAAWSAWAAGAAWSVGSVGSARSALDYNFDYYVIEYEYCKNPDDDLLPNANDHAYLEYCELLMQAKEYGCGYSIESDGVLYLVPTPIVKIDAQNRYHNEHGSAIRWKDGMEFYFLHGVNFDKDLYKKIIEGMPMQDILAIDDIDQRTQAIKFCKEGVRDYYKSQKGEVIDSYVKLDKVGRPINYELWRIPQGETFIKEVHFAVYDCPSARERGEAREYTKGVPEFKTVAEAMAWGMSDDDHVVTADEWKEMIPLLDEA